MLKVGILGAGFMGGTHAAAFAGLPDVQIVGISSRSAEKAAALAAKYGAEPFVDALKLATDPRVDVISNTLPTQLHKDLSIAALNAGKHVLVEKPMGLSVAECDEMIAAAEKSNRLGNHSKGNLKIPPTLIMNCHCEPKDRQSQGGSGDCFVVPCFAGLLAMA